MTLSGTRPWVIAGVIGALALVALTWLIVIGPTRSDTATLRADTATVQQQNQVLVARLDELRSKEADVRETRAAVRDSLASLPGDLALPELNQQLVERASARGVELTSISVAAATAPAAPTAPTADGATGAPSAGLVSVPVTIASTGSILDQLVFLWDLQKLGPRAALVTSTSLSDLDEGRAGDVGLTIQFTVFTAALSAADLAVLPQ